MKKKIGLFFGSFNPIHIGHLIIAEYCLEHSDLKEVWFVISPCNPLKKKESLLEEHHRLYMTKLAIEDDVRFRACDIEFQLPYPSYTAVTLMHLSEKYPNMEFTLMMGADNIASIEKWRNYSYILDNYEIMVYPRRHSKIPEHLNIPRLVPVDAPLIEISATQIRDSIKMKQKAQYMLPQAVARHIDEMNFYKK
ncbi:MAG: nicotinate-nucleotide adenylyltransferase [Bacteroidales bacterium]|jgi:nicotinate-nucleotide adenylyltransferase|nr:nicotinate-nucleotide adenylyltransferase [Bacteroidales bacterium]